MISADREPINRDAKLALSKGLGRVENVEMALFNIGNLIASVEFSKHARELLDAGIDLEYVLLIKKSRQPGYTICLDCKKMMPKQSVKLFIKLT